MTPPFYKVVVTNLTRGWSYTTTHGDTPNPADRVLLGDQLAYGWQFADEVLPSPLIRFTGKLQLVARTAADVPETQVGDRVQLDVRVGTTGKRIIQPPPMRVASCDVTLVDHKYAARVAIALVDQSADWRDRPLIGQYGTRVNQRMQWRERLAEYGSLLGISMGAPTSWPGTTRPAHPFQPTDLWAVVLRNYPANKGYPGKASERLAATLNSHQPNGTPHTAVTVESAGAHPTGYSYVGPSTWDPTTGGGVIPDPNTTQRIELVPAGRNVSASAGLPLVFTVTGGVLTLRSPLAAAAGDPTRQIGLDAAWCVFPAVARRDRAGVVNQVIVGGTVGITDDAGTGATTADGTYVYATADASGRGPSPREPDFDLYLGNRYTHIANSWPVPWPGPAAAAPYFASDASALAAPYSYDAFELRASLVPDAVAADLLPTIAPRLPAETDGDGRLVRHLTVYGMDPDIRFAGQPVLGFVVSGSLTIVDGELVFTLLTVPGNPTVTGGSATPVLVSEVVGTATGAVLPPNIDPQITVAELAYVDY